MQPAQGLVHKDILVNAAALQRLKISDETPHTPGGDGSTTPDSNAVKSSGAASPALSISAAGSGTDDDMGEFDGHNMTPANDVTVTSAAEELEEKAQAFEDKVSQLYSFMLHPLTELTYDCRVLDTD
jgi:hypothetical protein